MQAVALTLAIVSTVAYHVVTRLVPAGVNPLASLLVTYLVTCAVLAAWLVVAPAEDGFRGQFAHVNWTAPTLAAVVVLLDLGFVLLYRSGFPLSLGALVTQVAAALALLALGLAAFGDRLTAGRIVGVLLCLVGLWLVQRD